MSDQALSLFVNRTGNWKDYTRKSSMSRHAQSVWKVQLKHWTLSVASVQSPKLFGVDISKNFKEPKLENSTGFQGNSTCFW